MSPFVLFGVLLAMLVAHVVQVIKHRQTVNEMRQRHLLSLFRLDDAVKAGFAGSELTVIINQEVRKA